MDFRKIAAAQLTSTVISGLVAIYLAFSGFGVWSLVAMYIASAIVNVIAVDDYTVATRFLLKMARVK
jgi:teichuronic acid exporter